MKKLPLCCLFAVLLISCKKNEIQPVILIRIANQAEQTLSDISVFSSQAEGDLAEKRYGTVPAGARSLYLSHEKVFSLPLLRYIAGGSVTYEFSNIRCGMGLTYLEPGKYSLVIRGQSSNPEILFVKD